MSPRIILLVAAAGVLTACERSVEPTGPVRSAQSASFDQVISNTNSRVDVTDVVTACNGDVVTLTGTAHIRITQTNSGTSFQINLADLRGVDLTSGVRYHENGIIDQALEFVGSGPAFVTTSDTELISEGSTDNLLVRLTVVAPLIGPPTVTGTAKCEG